MKEYRDRFGRPIRRLYLKTEVLDKRCEGVIREFMERCSGGFRLPIPTNEVVRLIEERTSKFDSSAKLPPGIHGQTSLYYDRRPVVKISERLFGESSDHLERTTLVHEFGHVWLHGPLWREVGKLRAGTPGPVWTCNRTAIIEAPRVDWMEWQAGWVSGAILMPATAVRAWAAEIASRLNMSLPFPLMSQAGGQLVYLVAERCDVSQHAARVRLFKLGLVLERQ